MVTGDPTPKVVTMNAITLTAACAALCAFALLPPTATRADWLTNSLSNGDQDGLVLVAAKSRKTAATQDAAKDDSDRNSAADCGAKTYCKEMSSCAEARHYMNDCGMDKLDRDGDGIPCENVCGKR